MYWKRWFQKRQSKEMEIGAISFADKWSRGANKMMMGGAFTLFSLEISVVEMSG